jgi:hypothetical protein
VPGCPGRPRIINTLFVVLLTDPVVLSVVAAGGIEAASWSMRIGGLLGQHGRSKLMALAIHSDPNAELPQLGHVTPVR